jgi:hypothetical protein
MTAILASLIFCCLSFLVYTGYRYRENKFTDNVFERAKQHKLIGSAFFQRFHKCQIILLITTFDLSSVGTEEFNEKTVNQPIKKIRVQARKKITWDFLWSTFVFGTLLWRSKLQHKQQANSITKPSLLYGCALIIYRTS